MNHGRYFNTSGPNIPVQHYTLMRPELVAKGLLMVDRDRYFTIWAPRQTGKSTYFRLLADQLLEKGYGVMHINLENFLHSPLEDMMVYVSREVAGQWGIELPVAESFSQLFNQLSDLQGLRLVLIIDEVEGLNPDLFGQFLHTIRNLYHSRDRHSLKSVILVGVSNIVGVVQDYASPFNIADNLPIPYFTDAETVELLGQHEAETGQRFLPEVKAKISHMTANQPGLVNGFAARLVEEYPDQAELGMAEYLKVEDWYLRKAIDKNVANIVNKAREQRPFVEQLLFTEEKIPFDINREAIRFLHTHGLLQDDGEGHVTFWVPLYKKCLYQAFYPYTNGETKQITQQLTPWEYFDAGGKLRMDQVIEAYQAYVKRRSFKYFREKDADGKYVSIKEAALMYSFETFMQAFLLACGGKSYLEPHTGPGRADLILNIEGREYVVEAKIYRYPRQFEQGKGQLANYLRSLGQPEGWYLVFVPNHLDLKRMRLSGGTETHEGVAIHTTLLLYDEEKDF